MQRYEEFLEYASKWGFFCEKYRIVSDDNEQSPPPSGHCGKRTKTTDARAKGPHAEGGQRRTKPPMSEPRQERAIRLPYKRRKRNSALSRGADKEVQSERNEEMADSIRRKWTLYMQDKIRRNERNVKKALVGCEGIWMSNVD